MHKAKISGIAILLGLTLTCGTAIGAMADTYPDCNYARSGYDNKTISAAQFLSTMLNANLSQAEADYLSASPLEIKYNDQIAATNVIAELDGDTLNIAAKEYSYTAVNGETVRWVPKKVDGQSINALNGEYLWSANGVSDEKDSVTVTYEAQLGINKNLINEVLNVAYLKARSASEIAQEKTAEYERKYAEYERACADYTQYIADLAQYEEDKEAYEDYVYAHSEWEKANAKYQSYLTRLNEYQSNLAAYNAYQAAQAKYIEDLAKYNNYVVAQREYEEKYAEYLEKNDFEKIATANYQISILNFIYQPVTSMSRTLSAAIMGGAVDTVLANRDVLKDYLGAGSSEVKAIDMADAATQNLRRLITACSTCTTDEAKYAFYVTNYTTLKDNFSNLLRALEYLYRNTIVHAGIVSQDKQPQYQILLAQLAVISNALDNNPVGNYDKLYLFNKTNAYDFDSSWKVDGKSALQVLENVEYLKDENNAIPLADGYPHAVEEPVKPEEVLQPTPPEYVSEPIKPAEVAAPEKEPARVEEPAKPTAVPLPPEEPIAYIIPSDDIALVEAYRAGNIEYRQPIAEDYRLVLHTELTKKFRNVEEITVRFYSDENLSVLLGTVTAERGSLVEFSGTVPEKFESGYTIDFDYWVDKASGNRVDIGNINLDKSDVNVYPHYSKTPNLYNVSWWVDGAERVDKVAFGSIPDYGGVPEKVRQGLRKYKFIGWDKQISPVGIGGAVYIAQFEESALITWSVNGNVSTESVWKGETPVYTGDLYKPYDEYRFYRFSGWDKDILPATGDETYVARYSTEYIMPLADGYASVKLVGNNFVADCTNLNAEEYDLNKIYILALNIGQTLPNNSGRYGLVINHSEYTLNIGNEDLKALYSGGVQKLNFAIAQTGAQSYMFNLSFVDGNGSEALLYDVAMEIAVKGSFNNAYSHLYKTVGESVSEADFYIYENELTFEISGGAKYEIYPKYNLSVVPNDRAEIVLPASQMRPGETVNISFENLAEGTYISSVYAVDSFGADVEFIAYSFRMPAADVIVGAVCSNYTYTITFLSDGNVLSSKTYIYGDEIVPPANPVKIDPNGIYTYTFAGWSQDIARVTGDAEYSAVYISELIPEREDLGPSKLSKILTAVTVIGIIVLVILAGVIIFVVVYGKTKKKQKGKNKKKKLKHSEYRL